MAKLEKLLGKVEACRQRLTNIPVILKRFRQSVLTAACSGRLTADGRVDLGDVRYMPNGKDFLPLYGLRDGDLLFTRYNGSIELLGVCGMVRDLGKQSRLYPDKLMRVRFDNDSILPAFVEVFFSAPEVHERVVAKSKSSAGQNGVSGTDIKSQPFALPPLAEQQEIVRRAEGLFALADQIEARFTQARMQVEKLTPSLLARAFRGELVPQDPNDEPASVLLEQINRQKDGTGTDSETTKSGRRYRRTKFSR